MLHPSSRDAGPSSSILNLEERSILNRSINHLLSYENTIVNVQGQDVQEYPDPYGEHSLINERLLKSIRHEQRGE